MKKRKMPRLMKNADGKSLTSLVAKITSKGKNDRRKADSNPTFSPNRKLP